MRSTWRRLVRLLAESVDDFAKLTQLTESTLSQRGGNADVAAADSGARRPADEPLARSAAGVSEGACGLRWSACEAECGRSCRAGSGGGEAVCRRSASSCSRAADRRSRWRRELRFYANEEAPITSVAPELDGLSGIRVSTRQETPIRFTLDKPAQILVGFFKSESRKAMNVAPDTEQWNIVLPNAVSQRRDYRSACGRSLCLRGRTISTWARELMW